MKIYEILVKNKGIFIISLLFIFLYSINLDKFPHVWVDEILFSNPAYTLIIQGKLGTTIFYGVDNMQNFTYWQPPLYLLLLSFSFKLFGLGVWQGRVVSVILGLISVIFTYALGKELYDNKVGMISSLLLTFNLLFFYVARDIRMDIAVVCFTLIATYLIIIALKKSNQLYYFLAGLFAMMSFLSHPNGLIGILTIYLLIFLFKYYNKSSNLLQTTYSVLKEKGIYLYSLALILTSIPYILYILMDFSTFYVQYMGNVGHSVFSPITNIMQEPSRYMSFFSSNTFNNVFGGNNLILLAILLAIIIIVILTIIAIFYALKSKKLEDKIILSIFFSQIVLFMVLVSNKAVIYLSILLPYWSIIIARICYNKNFEYQINKKIFYKKKNLISSFFLGIIITIIIFNFGAIAYSINSNSEYDYYAIKPEISNYIPNGSIVIGDHLYYIALANNYDYYSYKALKFIKPDYIIFNNQFNMNNLTIDTQKYVSDNYKEIGFIPKNKNIEGSPIKIYKKIN